MPLGQSKVVSPKNNHSQHKYFFDEDVTEELVEDNSGSSNPFRFDQQQQEDFDELCDVPAATLFMMPPKLLQNRKDST